MRASPVADSRWVSGGASIATRAPEHAQAFRFPRALYFVGYMLSGALVLRPLLGLTAGDIAFLFALVAALPEIAVKRHVSAPLPGALTGAVLLFAAGGLLSGAASGEFGDALAVVLRLLYLVCLWIWLGMTVLRTASHVRTAMLFWGISLAASSIAAMVQLVFGDVIPGGELMGGRMGGLAQHPNDLGGAIAIALVPVLSLAIEGPRRLMAWGLLVLMISGLMLSGSVGSGVVALVAFLVWLRIRRQLRWRAVAAVVLLWLAALAASTLQERYEGRSPMARFTTEVFKGDETGTYERRIDSVRAAWASVVESPWIGEGPRPEGVAVGDNTVHDSFMRAWFEAGILGALGILGIYLSVAVYALRALRSTGPVERASAEALAASAFAGFLCSLGSPLLFQRYAWIPVALLLALLDVQRRAAKRRNPRIAGLARPRSV